MRGASEQMRTKKKEAMVTECWKLKMGPSLPWSLLQMSVSEKNAFVFYKRLPEMNADKRKVSNFDYYKQY